MDQIEIDHDAEKQVKLDIDWGKMKWEVKDTNQLSTLDYVQMDDDRENDKEESDLSY